MNLLLRFSPIETVTFHEILNILLRTAIRTLPICDISSIQQLTYEEVTWKDLVLKDDTFNYFRLHLISFIFMNTPVFTQ
jgi:hypothetical protein